MRTHSSRKDQGRPSTFSTEHPQQDHIASASAAQAEVRHPEQRVLLLSRGAAAHVHSTPPTTRFPPGRDIQLPVLVNVHHTRRFSGWKTSNKHARHSPDALMDLAAERPTALCRYRTARVSAIAQLDGQSRSLASPLHQAPAYQDSRVAHRRVYTCFSDCPIVPQSPQLS